MTDSRRPLPVGVDHVGLSVRDLVQSETFYCEVLGAEIVFRRHRSEWGQRTVIAVGGTAVDLNHFEGNSGAGFDPTNTGLDHLAFTADTRDQLEAWAAWLDANSVARSEIREVRIGSSPDAPSVGAMFDFRDPDGIQLEFIFMSLDVARGDYSKR